MTEDWMPDDPFANPEDPAAREREQRRLEREEKRRQREAKPEKKEGRRGRRKETAPAAPSSSPPPVDPEPVDPGPSAVDPAHPPTHTPEPPTAPEPVPTPEPPLSARSPEQEFWDEDPPAAEDTIAEEEPAADAAAAQAWHEPRTQSWEAPDEGPAPERTPDSRGPGRGRGGSGGSVLARARRHPLLIVAIVIALVFLWFLWSLFQPFHGDGSGRVAITVPKGASVSEVGDLLDEKGVVDSSTFFQIRATLAGKRSELYPGHFTLAHGMSYGAAIDALSKPPVKRITTVTIPEGYSRSQAAQLVEEDGLEGDYSKETVRSKYLNPAQYGGKGAKDLEGFLFPDTFEMKPGAPTADLVQLQLQDFKRRIKGVDMSFAKSKNLTVFDVLIIASMIEREAGVPSQRKLVASVVYNRLHEGMPLGIDATIRFATGNYEAPLTESELAVDSPYNTRTNAGLPPGPINSPGIESIEAAAHPAKSNFLFYVNKPNTCGELAFAKNEAEFEADVGAYNAAREANGGNEPTSCGE
jgi:UPF0755 protein